MNHPAASAAAEAAPLLGAFGPTRFGPRKAADPGPPPRGRPPGSGSRAAASRHPRPAAKAEEAPRRRPAAWGAVRGLVGRLGLHRPAVWWEPGLPAALAVANVWVTAQVGLVAGEFYLALGEADEAVSGRSGGFSTPPPLAMHLRSARAARVAGRLLTTSHDVAFAARRRSGRRCGARWGGSRWRPPSAASPPPAGTSSASAGAAASRAPPISRCVALLLLVQQRISAEEIRSGRR